MKKGFTLIEMLLVVGIIAILIVASMLSYSGITKSAEKARAQELVSNVATALTAYYQENGLWPKALVSNSSGQLTAEAALVLAKLNCLSLSTDSSDPRYATKLIGLDQFGVVTPWATAVIKKLGKSAVKTAKVANSGATVEDHILYYAIDTDGDGVIEDNELKGAADLGLTKIRATAAVWCIGKTGGDKSHKPWKYSEGRRKDDVYSWSYGQTLDK